MSPKHNPIKSFPVSPARSTDPATSHLAAARSTTARGQQRMDVYNYLCLCASNGATDYEISEALHILRGSSSKRRGELVNMGLVANSGQRRQTDTGSTAIVWIAI